MSTITVTLATDPTTRHSGISLRDAIRQVNAGKSTVIAFNIPGTAAGNKVIAVSSPLPAIKKPVIIDGTTEPGYADKPIVALTPANTTVAGYGLRITGGGATVKGLAIYGFRGYGLRFDTGGGNTVVGNFIGVTTTGTLAPGNGAGIWLNGSSRNTIGGTSASSRNVISGNSNNGIDVSAGSVGNTIVGNSIGTDLTGTLNLANRGNGIAVRGAGSATPTAITSNTIANNGDDGIHLVSATNVMIRGNSAANSGNYGIGLYRATNVVIQGNLVTNSEHRGIAIIGSSAVTVGGTSETAANTITANGLRDDDFNSEAAGVAVVSRSSNVSVIGNAINGNGRGIRISGSGAAGTSPSITVSGNTITGNDTHGVFVDNYFGGPSQNVLFTGNTIKGSGGPGLRVAYSRKIVIGRVGAAINDIEDNGANGIALDHATNVILTNNTVSHNAADGIFISKGCAGVTLPSGNTVQNNGAYGVEILSTVVSLPSTTTNTITGNTKGNVRKV